MKVLKSHELVLKHLFDSDENLLRSDSNPKGLTTAQLEIKKRCMVIYSRKLEDPLISDKVLVEDLKKMFNVEAWTIYNDIRAVEHFFLGSLMRANKEYIRFMVTEAQKKALSFETERMEKAQKIDEYYNTKHLSYASKVLGEVNNLDKEDTGIDPSQFKPDPIEISADVATIDIPDIGDEEVERLKRKYLKDDIPEAEIIDDDREA